MKIFWCTILIPLAAVYIGCSSSEKGNESDVSGKHPVIFDTDCNNELDDQHALAYLLLNGKDFVVKGVTVNATYNGGDISGHYAEAERVLRMCDCWPGVPLYKGANGSFTDIIPFLDSAKFDGSDAVSFIINTSRKYSNEQKLVLIMVGKLTNAALAFKKDPSIIPAVKIVWLGSNYPEPGEYNQDNDTVAMNYILQLPVEFEMVTVRYGKTSGTDAVRVTPAEINEQIRGKGPKISEPVMGRHQAAFTCFGDYSVNLFEHAELYGEIPSRALFDMAAVAIVKNPNWAVSKTIPCPVLQQNVWVDNPGNTRKIVVWENFQRDSIVNDFFRIFAHYTLVTKPN